MLSQPELHHDYGKSPNRDDPYPNSKSLCTTAIINCNTGKKSHYLGYGWVADRREDQISKKRSGSDGTAMEEILRTFSEDSDQGREGIYMVQFHIDFLSKSVSPADAPHELRNAAAINEQTLSNCNSKQWNCDFYCTVVADEVNLMDFSLLSRLVSCLS